MFGQIQNSCVVGCAKITYFPPETILINKLCVVMAFRQNIYLVLRSYRQKRAD